MGGHQKPLIFSFIGNQVVETEWLEEKFKVWTTYVETMAGVALRHPQIAYAGLKNYLQ